MIQARGGLRFSEEAGLVFGVLDGVRRQELQRDRSFELGVFSLVDDTHPAFPECLGDLVVGDRLADEDHSFLESQAVEA